MDKVRFWLVSSLLLMSQNSYAIFENTLNFNLYSWFEEVPKPKIDRNISSLNGESGQFTDCSDSEIAEINSYIPQAKNLISTWEENLNRYSDDLLSKRKTNARNKRLKDINRARSRIKCISENLEKQTYRCNSQVKACLKGDWAYTYPIINSDIHICSAFWGKRDELKLGIIIHEVSHKCGTTDAGNFYFKSPPKNTFFVHWTNIADTYQYWASENFCIPRIDCDEKSGTTEF